MLKSGGVTNPLTEATDHDGEVIMRELTEPDCKEQKVEVHVHVHTLQVVYRTLASFPVLPTPAFVSQPWRKSEAARRIKAGVGRTGNEAKSSCS